MTKDQYIKLRDDGRLKAKLQKKAKKYKVTLSDFMRIKLSQNLNDDNDKHLFI